MLHFYCLLILDIGCDLGSNPDPVYLYGSFRAGSRPAICLSDGIMPKGDTGRKTLQRWDHFGCVY